MGTSAPDKNVAWFPDMQLFKEGVNTGLTPLNTLFVDDKVL